MLVFDIELRRFFGSLFCDLPAVTLVFSCFDDTDSSKAAGAGAADCEVDFAVADFLRGALGFAGGGFRVNV